MYYADRHTGRQTDKDRQTGIHIYIHTTNRQTEIQTEVIPKLFTL